jgi:hypothetical protein
MERNHHIKLLNMLRACEYTASTCEYHKVASACECEYRNTAHKQYVRYHRNCARTVEDLGILINPLDGTELFTHFCYLGTRRLSVRSKNCPPQCQNKTEK